MKNKKIPHILTSAFLGFLLSFGGISCLATGFGLEISFASLALCCAVCALLSCAAFSFRKCWLLLPCALVPLTYYLLRRTQLTDQLLELCYRISRIYDSAYGCGWLGRPTGAQTIALPLYCWGGLNALIAGGCTARGRLTAIAVFFSLLPLALCLVLIDIIPALICLCILLLGLILLLLTQGVRRRNIAQAAALTWMLTIPVILAMGLLLATNPQTSYNKQHYADRMGDALLRAADRLPYIDIDSSGVLRFDPVRHIPETVNLANKGPNNQLRIPVMEVTAEASGPLYLRGRHYGCYTGAQWTVSGDQTETFTALSTSPYSAYGLTPQDNGELIIETSGTRSSRYLPYYPDMSYPLTQGTCANPSGETTYSYNWFSLPAGFENAVSEEIFADYGVLSSSFAPIMINEETDDSPFVFYVRPVTPYAYSLELPEDTRLWAEAYLAENLPINREQSNIIQVANAIAEMVRASADYDLDTPRMPDDRQDFARWFMEESDTGYCVHYATATTVLLRAAGIPARYVEGYLTEAVAGRSVTVTEKDAHAWAEYFVIGIGWIPLESTAGDLNPGSAHIAPSAESTQTDAATTAPTVTEPPTEPESDTVPPTDHTTAPSTSPVDPTVGTTGRPDPDTENPTVPTNPQQPEKPPLTVNKPAVITLCLLLLLLGQYPLRLRLREKRLQSGNPNSRAIKNWRFACRLAKLSRQALPAELEELALRAKFSQHILTEEDLAPYEAYWSATVRQLRDCPWWLKLYHRFVWAAY